jgi:hypothetical protein
MRETDPATTGDSDPTQLEPEPAPAPAPPAVPAHPHRILVAERVERPFPMTLLVPVDPSGVLAPGRPLLGELRCRCARCVASSQPRQIRIPPRFLARLITPGPDQRAAVDAMRARWPWLGEEGIGGRDGAE